MKEDWIYKRGDLYYANLNPYFGSEQGGTRPVLVLQNNVGNFFCPTLIVAPLTSKWIKKKELPTHYALESVPELGLKSKWYSGKYFLCLNNNLVSCSACLSLSLTSFSMMYAKNTLRFVCRMC